VNRISATALIVMGAYLIGSAPSLRADDRTASLALLERAQASEELRANGATPFTLHASISVAIDKEQGSGTYTLTWLAENRWHEELRFADFVRIRDGVDGGYRQVRTWDYQPVLVFDIDQLLDVANVAHLEPGDAPGKIRNRKIDGAEASCIEIRLKEGLEREACIDPATDLLVHVEQPETGQRAAIDYSGMVAIGDRKFPSQLRLTKPGGYSIEIFVTSIGPVATNADSLPVPDPVHSEFWAACRNEVRPKLAGRVDPRYPDQAKWGGQQGAVYIYSRIEPDGAVSHLRLLGSPSADLANAAASAVARWTFTPASCHGAPVRIETVLTVVFSLGG